MFTNLNCRSLRPVSVFSPPVRKIILIGWREAGGNYLWTFNIIFGNKNFKMFVQLLTLFFGNKNIKIFVHGLILFLSYVEWLDRLFVFWQPFFSPLNQSVLHQYFLVEASIFWFYRAYFLLLFYYCSFAPSLPASLVFWALVGFLAFSGSGSPVLHSSVFFLWNKQTF